MGGWGVGGLGECTPHKFLVPPPPPKKKKIMLNVKQMDKEKSHTSLCAPPPPPPPLSTEKNPSYANWAFGELYSHNPLTFPLIVLDMLYEMQNSNFLKFSRILKEFLIC